MLTRTSLSAIFWALIFISHSWCGDFLSGQIQYPRVQNAFSEKEGTLREYFKEIDLEYPPGQLFIRAFKSEKQLEVWIRMAPSDTFRLLQIYDICALSGTPGPKRRQGDLQIPEGFYHIDHFNPWSRFHLSLRLDYPNASDHILGVKQNPGGEIFIHGDCVTIGCIPITDDKIKEVYALCVLARDAGQSLIPVHIFPARLNDEGFRMLADREKPDEPLEGFWRNLQTGYRFFEKHHQLPGIRIDPKTGLYLFDNP